MLMSWNVRIIRREEKVRLEERLHELDLHSHCHCLCRILFPTCKLASFSWYSGQRLIRLTGSVSLTAVDCWPRQFGNKQNKTCGNHSVTRSISVLKPSAKTITAKVGGRFKIWLIYIISWECSILFNWLDLIKAEHRTKSKKSWWCTWKFVLNTGHWLVGG